jgi:hypothetical protein
VVGLSDVAVAGVGLAGVDSGEAGAGAVALPSVAGLVTPGVPFAAENAGARAALPESLPSEEQPQQVRARATKPRREGTPEKLVERIREPSHASASAVRSVSLIPDAAIRANAKIVRHLTGITTWPRVGAINEGRKRRDTPSAQ